MSTIFRCINAQKHFYLIGENAPVRYRSLVRVYVEVDTGFAHRLGGVGQECVLFVLCCVVFAL